EGWSEHFCSSPYTQGAFWDLSGRSPPAMAGFFISAAERHERWAGFPRGPGPSRVSPPRPAGRGYGRLPATSRFSLLASRFSLLASRFTQPRPDGRGYGRLPAASRFSLLASRNRDLTVAAMGACLRRPHRHLPSPPCRAAARPPHAA